MCLQHGLDNTTSTTKVKEFSQLILDVGDEKYLNQMVVMHQ